MTEYKKQEIAIIIIKVLKSRFDSFPGDEFLSRNAPFHKAFLQAFKNKFDDTGTNVDAVISMSSWMQGLNTTLGQMFFENVAHVLSDGQKRSFKGSEVKIYSEQERVIAEIMTDLKNGNRAPNCILEDRLISENASGSVVDGTNFTADCYFEDEKNIVAIELKSVRPNSGETRGEKQKILKAKAALRRMYPNKDVQYYFGFPFDPTADTDTGYHKARFMKSMVEFSKFCDQNEILLSDELWSFLSGEKNTMEELLSLIRAIATQDFMDNFNFLRSPKNLVDHTEKYIEIANNWYLADEIFIANNLNLFLHSKDKTLERQLNACTFNDNGEYNYRRVQVLKNRIYDNIEVSSKS